MRRLRALASEIGWSMETMRKQRQTPLPDRAGLPTIRWWKLPLCLLRGHSWWRDGRGYIEITGWRLQFCQCCGQEIAGRTSWAQIDSRPDDADDFIDWDDEPEQRP